MKKLNLLILTIIMLTLCLALTSCGGGGTEDTLLEITGVTFSGAEFTYDGTEKSIAISGTLPEGVSVSYENEKATNAGTYSATATLSGEGYKTKTLAASLVINKATITGITFTGAESTYDGTEKSIAISGTLPEGTSVSYTDAKATNAGIYNAAATVSGSNYNTLTLNAQLKINKADITGVTAEAEQAIYHDGNYHLPAYTGTLPSGVEAKYIFDGTEIADGVRAIGTYASTIVLSGANYNELSLNVSFKIKLNLANLAINVVNSFGSVPDVWEFLPETFAPENRAVNTQSPIDYTSFVNVSSIPTNGMGKQLNVAYGILTKAQAALSVVNTVYAGMNTVHGLYSTYLDSNPDDYQSYTGNAGAFTFTLNVGGDEYSMSASVGSVNVLISSSPADESYGARVQLTDTTVLQYVVEDGNITIGLSVLGSASMMLEFVREDDAIIGYLYENLTLLDKSLVNTSAVIYVGEEYTTVIGTKGDFIPTSDSRNCEIYKNSDGRLVGTKVRELVDIKATEVLFNTYWFPLYKLVGVDSIKKIDEKNDLNADSIYINGATELLETKKIGGFNLKTASRRFDIEFKTMYFYNWDETKQEYVSVEMEIPMLFIQEENYEDFITDFNNVNGDFIDGSALLLVYQADLSEIDFAYSDLLAVYDVIKDLVTADTIKDFCGITTEEES